jgi:hypothetical protein
MRTNQSSIHSMIVIANALNVTVSDLVSTDQSDEERIIIRASDHPFVNTAQDVIRRYCMKIAREEYRSS